MVPKYSYRLKDYRICQLANGRLWWEAHSEFGSQISGPCYIWGDILVIGVRCNEEIGFLKSEFLDSMRKLPVWRKTRYYCVASKLLDVNTGTVVNEDRLAQKTPLRCESDAKTIFSLGPGSFRLGSYQIVVGQGGRTSWKCSGGADRMIVGPAVIESDILFLAPGQTDEEKTTKRSFLSTLRMLPEWDRTILWCRSLGLKPVPKEERPTFPQPVRKSETFSRQGKTSAGRRNWDSAGKLWSQMVYFYDACVNEVRTKRLQKSLVKIIHKFKNKINFR